MQALSAGMTVLTRSVPTYFLVRHTLPIFSGCLAHPIILKIAGIIHLYIVYLCLKNQISIYKTLDFVLCALFIFFRKIFNSAKNVSK